MRRRIVVTGLGPVTAAGIGREAFWKSVTEGQVSLGPIDAFDTSEFPVKTAGVVRGFDPVTYINRRIVNQTDRHTHFGLTAAALALEDADLDLAHEDLGRVGVVVGNNLGGSIFGEEQLYNLHQRGARTVSAYQSIAWFYAATIGQTSIMYGLKGYSKTHIAERAGSLVALGDAFRVMQRGDMDVCLAGGCDAPISPYAMVGYLQTGLLATSDGSGRGERYAPFDRGREGLIIGEGAAILILEERDRARDRGARIYAELLGFGQTCDAVDYRASNDDGVQYARAIGLALRDSGVTPEEIGYVSVDGAAGRAEDPREARAIRLALGEAAATVPVSCPKTMFGHTFGAANAIEAAAACLTIWTGEVPPTVGLSDPDPECAISIVREPGLRTDRSYALVLGTARGGINGALVLGAPS